MAITLDGTNGILSPDFEPSSSTTPTNGLFLPTTNALGFATNSTERLRLDASGNLGLGVTPSAWYSTAKVIDINNTGSVATFTDGGIGIYSNTYLNSSAQNIYKTSRYAGYYQLQPDTGKHVWYTAPSGTAGAAISFTQAMTLDASGNLGIGTSSPGVKLDISGNARVSTYYNFNGNPSNPTDATAALYDGANVGPTLSGNSIAFRTGTTPSERARIDSSGNLLVGTTTASTSSQTGTAFLQQSSQGSYIALGHSNGSSAGTSFLYFSYNGSGIGTIVQNGTTGVTYNTTSDQRLKENIVDAPSAINSVNAIKIRSFDWKADGSHVDYGYIAQELLEVAPEAVSVPADSDEMMGVDFGKLTPRIIKAIQELTQRLEALEAK